MRMAAIKEGWSTRTGAARRSSATACPAPLAMTRYGLLVCGSAMSFIVHRSTLAMRSELAALTSRSRMGSLSGNSPRRVPGA